MSDMRYLKDKTCGIARKLSLHFPVVFCREGRWRTRRSSAIGACSRTLSTPLASSNLSAYSPCPQSQDFPKVRHKRCRRLEAEVSADLREWDGMGWDRIGLGPTLVVDVAWSALSHFDRAADLFRRPHTGLEGAQTKGSTLFVCNCGQVNDFDHIDLN